MGLTIREILNADYFKSFRLIAGHDGIDKHIQGVAVLDAPDGFNWTQGRELVISAGYIFDKNPDLMTKYFTSKSFKRISGMALKMRYIKEISDNILRICDEHCIPLIIIPPEPSWMEFMNQLNIIVMNKNIRQFNIGKVSPKNFSDLTYKERKINKILSQIEREMNFPAVIYDVPSDRTYLSSSGIEEYLGELQIKNLWSPLPSFSREILCDNLNMIRYRNHDARFKRPYSWITVPITVGNEIKAYFIVIEAEDLIDYYDQFTLRIGFLLLQSLFEQLLVAQSIGDIGFERWITDIVKGHPADDIRQERRAVDLGIDHKRNYYLLLMRQANDNIHLSGYREVIWDAVSGKTNEINGRMAITEENSCVFLFPVNERLACEENLSLIRGITVEIQKSLETKIRGIRLFFGLSDMPGGIKDIRRNYLRCEKAIQMGRHLYPDRSLVSYAELGTFAWLDIQEDEVELMQKAVGRLLNKPENRELIETLNTYLECNMNYSMTAKKRYAHINTVRNRIADINEFIDCDLSDPMKRLNLEILLKLFRNWIHESK